MHIAFVGFVTHYGGATRSTVELAKRLKDHAKVTIVDPYGCCGPYRQAVEQAGLDYHVLDPRDRPVIVGGQGSPIRRILRVLQAIPDLLALRAKCRTLLREIQPTLVYCNNAKSVALAASLLRRQTVPPIAVHFRGWYTPDMLPGYAKWLFRKRCAGLLAVSQATRAALLCARMPRQRVHVLPNPVDVEEMLARAERPPSSPPPQQHRPVRLLVPAALLHEKGQHTAVRALRLLLDAGYDPVLWLPGDVGYGTDGGYVARTQELARQSGVSDRVEWLGLRDDMPQLMKAATVVVLPTHAEGMPRAILEAMALARPVATTPVGGVLDLIFPGMTGLLFDVEDADGLAACVRQFADAPDSAERMGRTAQEYAIRNFSVNKQIELAMSVFRKVGASR